MRRMFSLKQLQEIADNRVKALVEGGTLSNAKPLYYHGIEVYKYESSVLTYQLTFVIIDNSPTLYTWTRFKEWLSSIPADVFVNANGFFNVDSAGIVNMSGMYHPKDTQTIHITGNDKDCTYISIEKSYTDLDSIIGTGEFHDRCNKLN